MGATRSASDPRPGPGPAAARPGAGGGGRDARAGLRVRPVQGRRDLRSFLALPERLHAGDPAWIAPLRAEVRMRLSPRSAFREHAEVELFLAERGGAVVGRASAQVDRLHVERHGPDGFFGMLEAEDDEAVFGALFGAAEEWLAARGMRRMLGPFDLGINQSCGLQVDGFENPPRVLMPHSAPYAARRLAEQGCAKEVDLLAYRIRIGEERPFAGERAGRAARARRVAVRPLDRSRMRAELRLLREVFEDAWAENWGFVPFTDRELAELGSLFRFVVPRSFALVAEVEGRAVGVAVSLPDVNEIAADLRGRLLPLGWARLLWRLRARPPRAARLALLGVRRAARAGPVGSRVLHLLLAHMRRAVSERGVREVEISWILEENRPAIAVVEALRGEAYKRYRIYGKSLDR